MLILGCMAIGVPKDLRTLASAELIYIRSDYPDFSYSIWIPLMLNKVIEASSLLYCLSFFCEKRWHK